MPSPADAPRAAPLSAAHVWAAGGAALAERSSLGAPTRLTVEPGALRTHGGVSLAFSQKPATQPTSSLAGLFSGDVGAGKVETERVPLGDDDGHAPLIGPALGKEEECSPDLTRGWQVVRGVTRSDAGPRSAGRQPPRCRDGDLTGWQVRFVGNRNNGVNGEMLEFPCGRQNGCCCRETLSPKGREYGVGENHRSCSSSSSRRHSPPRSGGSAPRTRARRAARYPKGWRRRYPLVRRKSVGFPGT